MKITVSCRCGSSATFEDSGMAAPSMLAQSWQEKHASCPGRVTVSAGGGGSDHMYRWLVKFTRCQDHGAVGADAEVSAPMGVEPQFWQAAAGALQ